MWLDRFTLNEEEVMIQDIGKDKANGLAIKDENGKLLDDYIPSTDIKNLITSPNDILQDDIKTWIEKAGRLGPNTQFCKALADKFYEAGTCYISFIKKWKGRILASISSYISSSSQTLNKLCVSDDGIHFQLLASASSYTIYGNMFSANRKIPSWFYQYYEVNGKLFILQNKTWYVLSDYDTINQIPVFANTKLVIKWSDIAQCYVAYGGCAIHSNTYDGLKDPIKGLWKSDDGVTWQEVSYFSGMQVTGYDDYSHESFIEYGVSVGGSSGSVYHSRDFSSWYITDTTTLHNDNILDIYCDKANHIWFCLTPTYAFNTDSGSISSWVGIQPMGGNACDQKTRICKTNGIVFIGHLAYVNGSYSSVYSGGAFIRVEYDADLQLYYGWNTNSNPCYSGATLNFNTYSGFYLDNVAKFNSLLYASTDNGYKSTSDFLHWEAVSGEMPSSSDGHLAVVDNKMYFQRDYRTSDLTQHLMYYMQSTAVQNNLQWCKTVNGYKAGKYETTDGVNWNINSSFSSTYSIREGDAILSPPFVSFDVGANWQSCSGAPSLTVSTRSYKNGAVWLIDPQFSSTVYRSTDSGLSWSQVSMPSGSTIESYVNGKLFATHVYSDDLGLNWQSYNIGSSYQLTSIAYSNGVYNAIFKHEGSSQSYLYTSTDASNWTRVRSMSGRLFTFKDVWFRYETNPKALYYSTDNCATWTALPGQPYAIPQSVNGFLIMVDGPSVSSAKITIDGLNWATIQGTFIHDILRSVSSTQFGYVKRAPIILSDRDQYVYNPLL